MDIIWLAKNSQGVFTRIISIILLISKVQARARGHHQNMLMLSQVPTWLAFANGLRQAGGSFGGLNIGGRDLGGATGMTPIEVFHAA